MHIAHYLQLRCTLTPALFELNLREPLNYYFSDLVRKGWGRGSPKVYNSHFAKSFLCKWGRGGVGGIEKSE